MKFSELKDGDKFKIYIDDLKEYVIMEKVLLFYAGLVGMDVDGWNAVSRETYWYIGEDNFVELVIEKES